MNFQEQYDDALFEFSSGNFPGAIEKLRAILAQDPAHFEAQLSLGMACFRNGDLTAAIAEGHKAEKLKPREQLVHTNLSLFYMRAGNKAVAEHHGLQARIASWREEAQHSPASGVATDPDLALARPKPPPLKPVEPFPPMPWKKK